MAKKGFSIPPSIKTFFKKRGVLVALALLVVCVLWMISRSSKHETADEYHYREALNKKGKCHRGWEPAGKTKDGKKRCRRRKDAKSVYGDAKWKSSGSLSGNCKNLRENLYRGYKNGSFDMDQFTKWSGYQKLLGADTTFKVCDCFESSSDCGLTQEQKDQIVNSWTNDITNSINNNMSKDEHGYDSNYTYVKFDGYNRATKAIQGRKDYIRFPAGGTYSFIAKHIETGAADPGAELNDKAYSIRPGKNHIVLAYKEWRPNGKTLEMTKIDGSAADQPKWNDVEKGISLITVITKDKYDKLSCAGWEMIGRNEHDTNWLAGCISNKNPRWVKYTPTY